MTPFAPNHTAVLAIDLQRAFCSDDGSVARQGIDVSPCRAAAEQCLKLVAAARPAGLPVIWTRMMFRPDYADGGQLIHELRPGIKESGGLQAGTPDVELIDGADVRPEDVVIDKCRFSAFIGTTLDLMLRQLDISTLVVGGVTTSICVESTVREASQRDYRTYVVRDACADLVPARHDATLDVLDFGFAHVLSLDAALDAMPAGSAAE